MNKTIFTFCLYIFVFVSVAEAQEKLVKRALKYIEKENFEKAKLTLDRVDLENSDAFIGDYYLAKGYVYDSEGKLDSAVMMYQKLIDLKNLNELPPKVIVDYARYQHNSGLYDEALAFIEKADSELNDTKYPIVLDRIKEQAFWAKENQFNFSSRLGSDSIIDVALGSNSLIIDVPRFGATFYKDSLVFASYTEYKRPNRTDEEAFEYNQIIQDYQRTNTDLYIASLDDTFDDRRLFSEELATIENEGAPTFNDDFTEMYFTRNVFKKGREVFMVNYARKENGSWKDMGPLNFNSDKFNTMHPFLSPDGKGLYFVSNNPGGYGGYDIYFAEGSGKNFSKPKNLGPTINTSENEIFPFMQNDTVMMYSSNGHLGFGGYDIFWVDVSKSDKKPHNLLQPINSASDDYCIVGNKQNPEQMLFFSDRDMSMGNFAIHAPGEKLTGEALSFKISLLPPGKDITQEDIDKLTAGNSLLKTQVQAHKEKWGITDDDLAKNNVLVGADGQPVLDENGKPVLVPKGNVKIGPDGRTLIGSDGKPLLNSDGQPITVKEGSVKTGSDGSVLTADIGSIDQIAQNRVLIGADGKPVLDANGKPIIVNQTGIKVGSDGKTLVGPDGKPVLDANGKPVTIQAGSVKVNPDGTILTADIGSIDQIAQNQVLVGADGKPVLDANGKPIIVNQTGITVGPDGRTLVGPDGKPVLDAKGNPVTIQPGSVKVNPDGTILTADAASVVKTGTGFASLYFDLNSSTLSDEARQNLMMVAEYLKAKKEMKLVIAGNAGLRGDESYNLVISAYRAYQVYDFLTGEMSISDESILLEANGKYFPNINTFDVEKGIENRRVDIKAQWAEPNNGLNVKFKLTGKFPEELVINLFDLFLEQNPQVDYLYRATPGKGIYRVAVNHNSDVNTIKQLNRMGNRDFLYENEVILIKEHATPVEEMVFEVNVKTLYYVPKNTDIQTVANMFGVSVEGLSKVNKLEIGQNIEARTRLIIPIE